MFAQARSARTDEQFISIAQDIWEHSDADDVDNNHSGFDFTTLLWYVLNDCVRTKVLGIVGTGKSPVYIEEELDKIDRQSGFYPRT